MLTYSVVIKKLQVQVVKVELLSVICPIAYLMLVLYLKCFFETLKKACDI